MDNPLSYKKVVYKETSDDWVPSFVLLPGQHLVRISLLGLSDGKYRVCAWGADDFGLEKDGTWVDSYVLFLKIIDLKNVTVSRLKELGLTNA